MQSPSSITLFPSELNFELFYFLPAEAILNMCQVSTVFSNICNNDVFWMNKLRYDYPEYFNLKPTEVTWRQAYLDLSKGKIKSFPVYYRGNLLYNIWLRNTNTEREALSNIKQLFEKIVPSQDRPNPVSVHVLLNVPNRHQYLPVLREKDVILIVDTPEYGRNLWENTVGFEIIEGKIKVSEMSKPNVMRYFHLQLPGQLEEINPYKL
jgi:hypothetical protein